MTIANSNKGQASTDSTPSLVDHFLIAMPQMQDSYFANTVIYMWRHTHEGALGLVVNLPIKMQLSEIFEQLDDLGLRFGRVHRRVEIVRILGVAGHQ